jgi:hypothetical protein
MGDVQSTPRRLPGIAIKASTSTSPRKRSMRAAAHVDVDGGHRSSTPSRVAAIGGRFQTTKFHVLHNTFHLDSPRSESHELMNPTYRFQGTSTDLLDADAVSRSVASPRPPFRWALVVLAVLWTAGGAAALRSGAGAGARPACLGAMVIYQYVLAPQLKRRRIVKDNAATEDVALTFGKDALEIEAVGAARRVVRWSDVAFYVERRHGILFSFINRTATWLPQRAFAGAEDLAALIVFLLMRNVKSR